MAALPSVASPLPSVVPHELFLYQLQDGKKRLEMWRDHRTKTLPEIELAGPLQNFNEANFRLHVLDEITSTTYQGEDAPPLMLPFVVLGDVPKFVWDALEIKRRSFTHGNKIGGGDECDVVLVFKPLFVSVGDQITKVKNGSVAVYWIPDNDEWYPLLS